MSELSNEAKLENSIRVLSSLLETRDQQLQQVLATAEKLMNYIEDLEVGIPRPLGDPGIGVC